MDSKTRGIIQRMEAYFLPQELEHRRLMSERRTTPQGGLDDHDVFGKEDVNLQDVLSLKRILTRLGEPVTRRHYDTVWACYFIYPNREKADLDYDERFRRLVNDEEKVWLEHELDKDRMLPPPQFPDRPLTLKEQGEILKQIKGFIRYHLGREIWVDVPTGNGQRTEPARVHDTAIHRRLNEIYKELRDLHDKMLPPQAFDKDTSPDHKWMSKGDVWRQKHIHGCHHCGAVDDINLEDPKC